MSTHPDETETERQILKDIRSYCGAALGDFLLSGYGREESVKWRAFIVNARTGKTPTEHRFLWLCEESGRGLPRGREPLVWAVLLRELRESPRGSRVISLRLRQVLEALGWGNTVREREFVEQVIAKYQRMVIIEGRSWQGEGAADGTAHLTRLYPLVECLQVVMTGEERVPEDAWFRLEFSETLSVGLRAGGLFNAEWVGLFETPVEDMEED
jgi:hypothetical protein